MSYCLLINQVFYFFPLLTENCSLVLVATFSANFFTRKTAARLCAASKDQGPVPTVDSVQTDYLCDDRTRLSARTNRTVLRAKRNFETAQQFELVFSLSFVLLSRATQFHTLCRLAHLN